jgi:glycine cleavage system H protein
LEEIIMSNIPAELKYSASHEWIKEEDGIFVIGLTDFAQSALGDIVFINLPEEGDEVTAGESFADVESVKAVSDVFSPVTGTICAVNEELLDDPAQVNEDPYGAWLIKVENVTGTEELLDAEGYAAVVEAEEA